jgi:hypothetical protein
MANLKRKTGDASYTVPELKRQHGALWVDEVMTDSVMRVRVRRLRKQGRMLNRDELKDIPPHVGMLRVAEVRDHQLSRPVLCARLLDLTTKVDTDMLPELADARLLEVAGRSMRLTGIERLQEADVAQTWLIEVE